jgi:IclR family transcriptional regulator, acetate operon repressor
MSTPTGTLERGLAILELLAARGETSAPDVAAAIGLSRSASYRIIDTLKGRRLVETDPATKRLRLGVRAVEVGMAALAQVDVVRAAPSFLRELSALSAETALLAVPGDDAMVYLLEEKAPQAVAMTSRPGSRQPLHCTALGKAALSAMAADERAAVIARIELPAHTPNTIVDRHALHAELDAVAERGYAVDDLENELGVGCVGAPVLDRLGTVVAAMSITGPASRILPQQATFGPSVARAATELSARLGYFSPTRELTPLT